MPALVQVHIIFYSFYNTNVSFLEHGTNCPRGKEVRLNSTKRLDHILILCTNHVFIVHCARARRRKGRVDRWRSILILDIHASLKSKSIKSQSSWPYFLKALETFRSCFCSPGYILLVMRSNICERNSSSGIRMIPGGKLIW